MIIIIDLQIQEIQQLYLCYFLATYMKHMANILDFRQKCNWIDIILW